MFLYLIIVLEQKQRGALLHTYEDLGKVVIFFNNILPQSIEKKQKNSHFLRVLHKRIIKSIINMITNPQTNGNIITRWPLTHQH
jgi:hypothetical protein